MKIAFILGKQGSGKTTRVCQPASLAKQKWQIARRLQLKSGDITISSNTYNHIELTKTGTVELVAGVHENFRRHSIQAFPKGVIIIELPHSGYMPENVYEKLLLMRIKSKVFLLELEENKWLSIGGETGDITSPEYFLSQGRSLSPRCECDYEKDTMRIQQDILKSGIPSKKFSSAEILLKALKTWVIFGF